jgi:hypothetical protein
MALHVVPCGQHWKPDGQLTALGQGQQPQPVTLKLLGEHVAEAGHRVSVQFVPAAHRLGQLLLWACTEAANDSASESETASSNIAKGQMVNLRSAVHRHCGNPIGLVTKFLSDVCLKLFFL